MNSKTKFRRCFRPDWEGENMARKIVVCDDEQGMTRQISAYLDQIARETGDEFQVFYFSSGEELVQYLPEDTQVLLLDIQMGEMSGMNAARLLREKGLEKLDILFITSRMDFALEGYEVHAFAFLEKPLQYAALRRNLVELFARRDREKAAPVLTVAVGTALRTLPLSELLYAEVLLHDTSFVTASETIVSKIPLSEVEKKTAGQSFFRCHKSYLINLRHIRRIDYAAVTMDNGDVVPLSKYKRKELLETYAKFLGVGG